MRLQLKNNQRIFLFLLLLLCSCARDLAVKEFQSGAGVCVLCESCFEYNFITFLQGCLSEGCFVHYKWRASIEKGAYSTYWRVIHAWKQLFALFFNNFWTIGYQCNVHDWAFLWRHVVSPFVLMWHYDFLCRLSHIAWCLLFFFDEWWWVHGCSPWVLLHRYLAKNFEAVHQRLRNPLLATQLQVLSWH